MSSAGFNGTAGSTSAASADVAKMHPLQSAKIVNGKREKKQYCIQFVEMARPNLFSRAVAAWPEHSTQGDACVANTKACFCLDDKQNSRTGVLFYRHPFGNLRRELLYRL